MSGGFEDSFIVTATIEGQPSVGATAQGPREVTQTTPRQSEAAKVRSPVSTFDCALVTMLTFLRVCARACVLYRVCSCYNLHTSEQTETTTSQLMV